MARPLPTLAPRLPGLSPPPGGDRPYSKEHTEAEWEEKREVIKNLYITEKRKLSETMAILESRYEFSATEQMYKKRLKKWKISKRIYQRKSPATSSTASLPSSPAGTSESPANDDNDDATKVPTRPTTPISAISIVQPSTPEAFVGLEVVLSSVFSWSKCKLDSQGVMLDPMSRYLASPNQPPIQDSRTMYRTFELVFELWKHGKGDLAGMAARNGFYVLEYVLTEDHPDLIWHILDTIYDMVDTGHLQLLGLFVEHATALSQSQLPAQHPLFRIFRQLKQCDYKTDYGRQYICHLLRKAWLCNVELLSEQIGSPTQQQLWLYEQLIWDGRTCLRSNSGLAGKQGFVGALKTLKATQNLGCEHLKRVDALVLKFTQMELNDQPKAEQLAFDLVRKTDDRDRRTRSSARFNAYARKMLARINQDRCEWALAEENFRLAIESRELAHGTANSIRVVRDMWPLAAHFRHIGREREAQTVTQDAIARAQECLKETPGKWRLA